MFWSRWRKEYLPQLQQRQKWTDSQRDLRNGDVVLLKDKSICRTQWPIGRIVNAIKRFRRSRQESRSPYYSQRKTNSIYSANIWVDSSCGRSFCIIYIHWICVSYYSLLFILSIVMSSRYQTGSVLSHVIDKLVSSEYYMLFSYQTGYIM
jgi:hypothetical protein